MTRVGGTPSAAVSRGALQRNAARAAASGARAFDRSLLRGDAWGHGAELVAEAVEAAGLVPGSATASAALIDPVELYGLPGANPGATPVMRLSGTVLATKLLRAGEGVSYGYLYRASADTRIALVAGGYAQGVVRALGNAAAVSLSGRRCAIIGRVAMDACVIETADAEVHRGDEAVFFGDPGRNEPPLAEWVEATGMTAGELVTAVGLHANRVAEL